MEYVCRNMELQNNASIIGDKDQILQIVLKKNDSIVLNKQNLYYFSSPDLEESLSYKKNSTLEEQLNKIGRRVKNDNLVKIRNIQNNFEYVGIYNGGRCKTNILKKINFLGKIMKI